MPGRDIDNSTHTHLHDAKKSSLREMVEKLQEDCENDPDFKTYIDELQHYISPALNNQKDLKTKLEEAGRDFQIEDATELKEKFAKRVLKQNLSEAAQKAYANILAKIKSIFRMKIVPLIKEGKDISEIDQKVFDDIVQELYERYLRY